MFSGIIVKDAVLESVTYIYTYLRFIFVFLSYYKVKDALLVYVCVQSITPRAIMGEWKMQSNMWDEASKIQ